MSNYPLQQALHSFLRCGWENVPLRWVHVLTGIKPAFDNVREDTYPTRLGSCLAGAPVGEHIFKSSDRLVPEDVKTVVIGQDLCRRVGRAFAHEDLSRWSGGGNSVTTSMKRLSQVASHQRARNVKYHRYHSAGGWSHVLGDFVFSVLNFNTPFVGAMQPHAET